MFLTCINTVCSSPKLSSACPTIFRNADFSIAISRLWKLPHHDYFSNIGFHVTLISLKQASVSFYLKLLKLSLTTVVGIPKQLINLLIQLINKTEAMSGDTSK